MALTNLSLLTDHQKKAWSMSFWSQARNNSFLDKFTGTGPNSMIQRVTELTKSKKGNKAILTLVADLVGDGVVGDRTLKGNEEALSQDEIDIRYDQMRNANKTEGKMAEQKTIVQFREQSRDKLSYWLGDRLDQLGFLTLSGRAYTLTNNGATRVGSDLPYLEFAADVTAPTSKRVVRWNGTTKGVVENGATSAVTTADTPMWELFIQLKAMAKDNYIRGFRANGAEETFKAFLTPQGMAKLKLDPTYMLNLRHAVKRAESNPLFTGETVEIDGIQLYEFRHVYNTSGAASGSKWGGDGTVEGFQLLFCGAQALAMADIGNPEWVEEDDDYENQMGIAISKMVGFRKPRYKSIYANNTTQDFGVISAYCAQ